jgi:CubicO group peptidase (beta-lactamase class C family)
MRSIQYKNSIALYILAIFLNLVFFHSYAIPSVSSYPKQDWKISTPEMQGMHSQMLAEMMEYIEKNNFNIDSLLIVRNGYMVFDAYFYPFSNEQKHHIYSCTKSIMSALIGIAIDKGYIQNVNQPITDFFPDKAVANADDLKKSITVENLLTMASGLNCGGWAGFFDMWNSDDWAQYVLDLPMAGTPGEKFEYCDGASYLLSAIIQSTTKMKTLDFARKHLFEPLGILEIEWLRSPQGIDAGYGDMWLKPHDMAKIGWLYLNMGRWDNTQMVTSAWVEISTRAHIDAKPYDKYGYHWWVDSAGYYLAAGYRGQRIFVVPDKNIVAVFTGSDERGQVSKKLLDSYIIPAVSSADALPSNTEGQARLDALVNRVAEAKAYTWTSENEGIAKDGVFKRTASPAFKFEYPVGSRKEANRYRGQVMGMRTPGNIFFSAYVVDIPDGMKIEEFVPKFYAQNLKNYGSNIKVISNIEIVLKCGTKAYRTDIRWLRNNNIWMSDFIVSVYKDGKCIYLIAETWKYRDKLEAIIQSLTFK